MKNPSRLLDDVGGLSSREIVNGDIYCAGSQGIVSNVASGENSLGMETSTALVMLCVRVNGTTICHSGVSMTHSICTYCLQHGLASVVLHVM